MTSRQVFGLVADVVSDGPAIRGQVAEEVSGVPDKALVIVIAALFDDQNAEVSVCV